MTTADVRTAGEVAPPRRRLGLPELIEREDRRRRRRHLVAWAAALAVPLLAVALWLAVRPKPVPLAARFREQAVTRGDVTRVVRATGHVEALETVTVGAEVSGKIASVEVDFNDRVRKGQVLARFDRSSLAAQAAQAQAMLTAARAARDQAIIDRDKARRDLARADGLFASRSISQAEHDAVTTAARLAEQRADVAQSQLAAQQAAYAVASTNLAHGVILSPIDGVVITRNIDPGQTVASMLQTPVLFTVAADLSKMRVIAAVDEADIGEVHVGETATFTVNAYPSRTFEGVVTEVRNAASIVQDVVTYGTEIDVSNPDLALKPGMTASVRVMTARASDVPRVPNAALQFTPPGEPTTDEPGVWTLAAGALRRVPVTPGVSDDERTAIAPGALPIGAEVLTELTPEGRKAYGLAH